MAKDKSPEAGRLIDAFGQFRSMHKHNSPISGLRPSEFYVLVAIRKTNEGEGVRVSDLARKLDVATPTATQLIKRLESSGYVERKRSEKDKRSVRVVLTVSGTSLLDSSFDKLVNSFEGLVLHLGSKDAIRLAELLEDTVEYFKKIRD